MNNTTNSWEGFDALIRDITAQGFMAKSEARRRFNLIIEQALKEGYERGWDAASKMPDAAIEKIRKEAQKEFDAWKEGELDRAMQIREVAKREAMIATEELIEAYKEYVALLGAVEGTVAGFMAAHGWEQIGTDKQVARGKELREKIASLTKE